MTHVHNYRAVDTAVSALRRYADNRNAQCEAQTSCRVLTTATNTADVTSIGWAGAESARSRLQCLKILRPWAESF
jgi:hypothetical protein